MIPIVASEILEGMNASGTVFTNLKRVILMMETVYFKTHFAWRIVFQKAIVLVN